MRSAGSRARGTAARAGRSPTSASHGSSSRAARCAGGRRPRDRAPGRDRGPRTPASKRAAARRRAGRSLPPTSRAPPRTAGNETQRPRPEEDQRPAPLALGELDRFAALALHLAHHVLEPVVVERHVLEPAERRPHLAPSEPGAGERPLPGAGRTGEAVLGADP